MRSGLFCFCVLFLFSSCSELAQRESPIPKARGLVPETKFPHPPLPPKETEVVRNAKVFDDLFSLDRVVKLEAKDTSLIGYLRQVRYVGDRIIVLDDIRMSVLLFDDQGNFLRTIGRRGKGPGEYSEPTNVYVYGSEIAVVDTKETRILFFSFDGTHNRTIRPDNSKLRVFFYENIIIRDNLMYVCDFHSLNKNIPKHVVLDTGKKPAEPIFGFGDRLPFYTTSVGRKTPFLPTYIFKEVNSMIWTIPGYQTAIDVFDFNGHQLGSIPSGIDGISPEIVSKTKNIQDFNEAISMTTAAFMFHHDQFVFVYYMSPQLINAYDTNGNLIKKMTIEKAAIENSRFMENGYLIAVMNISGTAPEYLKRSLGDDLYTAFLDAGYTPDNYQNDNDYLIFHKPKW